MKEESENTVDVEQLLRDKSWEQLSAEEQAAAAEAFGSAAEYDRVRVLMMDLRSESGIEEEELKPSKQVRENLLAAFDDEQRRRRVLWWNSLGFWLRDQLRFDIPAVRFAVAGVVLTVGIIAVMQLMQNDAPQSPVAVNDKAAPVTPEQDNPKLDDNREPEGMNASPFSITEYVPVPVYVPQIIVPPADSVVGKPVHIVPGNNDDKLAINDSAANNLNIALVDSAGNLTPFVSNSNFACCGGATTLNATAASDYSYQWVNANGTYLSPVNANIGVTNVYVPNCRSLANDPKVIDAMFSMK